jgi:hypothetical protein
MEFERMSRATPSQTTAAFGLLLACQMSWAAPGIYTCVDASGKRLTSDRPIAACVDREQRVLNADGSVKQTLSRTLTAEERAEKEARDRQAAAMLAAQQDAVRRDRNLLNRFPNEAAHNKAREAALDDVRKAMKTSEARVELLAKERQPLQDETEFYVGKPLPSKLKRALDANDASTAAQRSLILDQQSELRRINALYDAELAQLRQLWAGAQPGTVVMNGTPAVVAQPGSGVRKVTTP